MEDDPVALRHQEARRLKKDGDEALLLAVHEAGHWTDAEVVDDRRSTVGVRRIGGPREAADDHAEGTSNHAAGACVNREARVVIAEVALDADCRLSRNLRGTVTHVLCLL